MIPLWYQGLSDYFHEKFDKQEFVDVIFRCYDGVVGGHQLLLSLSSRFLFRVFAEYEKFENEINKRSSQESSLKKINTLEVNRKLQYTEHNLKTSIHTWD